MTAYGTGLLVAQTIGVEPGTVAVTPQLLFVDTGNSIPGRPDYVIASVPINAGQNSYEAYFRFSIDRADITTNALGTVKIWVTGSIPTGVALKYKANWTGGTSAYARPVIANSSIATTSVATSAPTPANVTIGSSLATTKTVPFMTDYIVMQVQTTSAAVEGEVDLTLNAQYTDASANTYTATIPIKFQITTSQANAVYYDIAGTFNDYIDINGVFPDEAQDNG